jgi:hypothetical protein
VGPFFQETRIRTSSHLYVSTKSGGTWSAPSDYSQVAFATYLRQPWRMNSLRYGNYERYLTRHISNIPEQNDKSHLHDLRAFRELNQLLTTEWIVDPVDSIQLVYYVATYDPSGRVSHSDTLMVETYNPSDIAPSKVP